jgi:hypothetical protein
MATKIKQTSVGRVVKPKKKGSAKKHPNKHESVKKYNSQGR